MAKKNIVVLGAGFGGLRAAMLIAQKLRAQGLTQKYEVILVDRNDHQAFTPLLYEVATTSKETADIHKLHEIAAYHIPSLIAGMGISFIQDEITTLGLAEGDIHLKRTGKVSCEFVVLALGSEVNFFGIPGAKENALPLKTFANAITIRDTIMNMLGDGKKTLDIVVGGGGATGVELAGELKAWCGELDRGFHGCKLNVSIVEALPSVLYGLDPRVIKKTERRLEKIGVTTVTNGKIVSVEKNAVVLEGGKRIPFDLMIWSGGVKATAILSELPLGLDKGKRPITEASLTCVPQTPDLKLHAKVYGIGDNVCFMNPKTERPAPAVARVAIDEAKVAAWNIIEEIKTAEQPGYRPKFKTYAPMEYPYVIPAGGKYAVAKIGPFVISGFVGWIFKGLVELEYLFMIMSPFRALRTWLTGLVIFIQNDRLG